MMSKRNPFTDPYADVLSRLCKLSRKKIVPLDQALACIKRARSLVFSPPVSPECVLGNMQLWKLLKVDKKQGQVLLLMMIQEDNRPKRFIQKVICCVCGRYIRYNRVTTKKNSGDSHGFCKTCYKKEMMQFDKMK
jgi:hypothetical protein